MNNRIIYPLSCCVAVLLTLFSCVQEDVDINTPREDAMVSIVIKSPGAGSSPTRAISDASENDVSHVDVLLFNAAGQADAGKFFYRATSNDIQGTGTTKNFTVNLPRGKYDVVILANAKEIVSGVTLRDRSKADVLAEMNKALPASHKWLANSDSDFDPFPMWGRMGEIEIQDNMTADPVSLLRMVARVDLQLGASVSNFKIKTIDVYNYNTVGTVVPKESDVDNNSVKYPNLPSNPGFVDGNTDGPVVYNISNPTQSIQEIYLLEADNHKAGAVKDRLERTCLVVGGEFNDSGITTYYRVDFSGNNKAPKNPAQNAYTDGYWDIIRNRRFYFTVTNVTGPGYPDSEAAFTAAPANMEIEVVAWDQYMDDLVFDGFYVFGINPNQAEVEPDAGTGSFMLKTDAPRNQWQVTKEGSWITSVDCDYQSTDADGYDIYTVTYTYQVNEDPYNPRTGSISVTRDVSLVHTVTQKPAVLERTANCYMTVPGGGEIRIPIWRHLKKAIIGENGRGVAADNPVGDAKLDDNWLALSSGQKYGVAILWSDQPQPSSVVQNVEFVGDVSQTIQESNASAYITVKPGATQGNAVIILYVDVNSNGQFDEGTDGIKWSWHIWNTPYQPGDWVGKQPTKVTTSETVDVTNGKVHKHHNGTFRTNVFMDRNLGSLPEIKNNTVDFGDPNSGFDSNKSKIIKTYGLYYQWGRKDPFPGPADNNSTTPGVSPIYSHSISSPGIDIGNVNNSNNLENAVKNPLTMYNQTTNDEDWFTNDILYINEYLWGPGLDDIFVQYHEKSVFDPCPVGWRIPISGNNYDYTVTKPELFFPWSYVKYEELYMENFLDPNVFPPENIGGANFDSFDYYRLGYYPRSGYGFGHQFTGVNYGGANWTGSRNSHDRPQALMFYHRPTTVNIGRMTIGFRAVVPVRCVAEYQ